jgi:hypothetical protein
MNEFEILENNTNKMPVKINANGPISAVIKYRCGLMTIGENDMLTVTSREKLQNGTIIIHSWVIDGTKYRTLSSDHSHNWD